MQRFTKTPEAVLDYSEDWSSWLGADTLVTSTWEITPSGLTKESDSFTATTTTIWLSGGTLGGLYTVKNIIGTAGGRTNSRAFEVAVMAEAGEPAVGATSLVALVTELAARLQDASHTLWSLDQKKRFINAAIRLANEWGAYRLVKDESLVVIANTVEYPLPAALSNDRALVRVSVEGLTGYPYNPHAAWEVVENHVYGSGVENVSLTLLLPRPFPETPGQKIRLEYAAPHQELTADSDTTSLPAEYILAYALFMAHQETRADASVDRRYHTDQAQQWYQIAQNLLTKYLARLPVQDGRVVGAIY
jgi:hypothetical protein